MEMLINQKLREYLSSKGILVFPGFEISTSEKIHIVCLFSENTEEQELEILRRTRIIEP